MWATDLPSGLEGELGFSDWLDKEIQPYSLRSIQAEHAKFSRTSKINNPCSSIDIQFSNILPSQMKPHPLFSALLFSTALAAKPCAPIPIIYDTDIGEDIDDTWALCFLLNSPEVDVKLVTTNFVNAQAKLKIASKVLQGMGREDIPIAAGHSTAKWMSNYYEWAKDFDLSSYKGEIREDGVGEIINAIMADKTGRLQLHAVGPMHNIAQALEREPRIAEKVELVIMACRFADESKESNVRCGIPEMQKVLAANWKAFRIAPSDVTKGLRLTGERYQKVYNSQSRAARTTIPAYKIFERNAKWANFNTAIESSSLHDTVSSYMAWSTEFFGNAAHPGLLRRPGNYQD